MPKSQDSEAMSSNTVTPEPETHASDSEQDADLTTQDLADQVDRPNESMTEDLDDLDPLEDTGKLCMDLDENEDSLEDSLETDLHMEVDEEYDTLAPAVEENTSSIKDDVEMNEDQQIEDDHEDSPTEEAQNDCGGEEDLTKSIDDDFQCSEAARVDEVEDEIGNTLDIQTVTDEALNDNVDNVENEGVEKRKSVDKLTESEDNHEVGNQESDHDIDATEN